MRSRHHTFSAESLLSFIMVSSAALFLSRLRASLVLFAALWLATLVHAQGVDELSKTLKERMPELGTIESIKPLPYGGLFEVVANGELFYVTSDAKAVMFGQLIDVDKRSNVTRARQAELGRINWEELPLSKAIKVQRGDGKRMMAIFEDPNCGYCKQLEQDLQQLKDITVYVFLLPILSPDSKTLARQIWCAKNPAAAWQAWILNNVPPPMADASCQAPLQELLDFGRARKIQVTPTLFFTSGTRAEGAIRRIEVEAKLAEKKPG